MATNPLTAAASADMKWAFPDMVNPTIIDLSTTGSKTSWQFGANEDVIFIGPTTPRTVKVQTDGGHNIVLLGGEFHPNTDTKSATLHFLNLNGAVHVEGTHIDSKNGSQDGIAVGGASGHQPTVTVQNTLIENVHGSKDGVHADVFQTHGSVGDMRFYNVTGSTNYQGFFIAPQYDPPHKSADFENVNIKYIAGGGSTTYQYWFLDDKSEHAFPITLKNVYATERSGQSAEESSVWPKASLGDSTHAVRVGNQITWPGLPYKGAITVGAPAKDFATIDKVGANFHPDGVAGTPAPTPAPTVPDAPAPAPEALPPSTEVATDVHDSAAPTKWLKATDPTKVLVGTDGNDQLAGVQKAADIGLAGGKGDDTYIAGHPADKVIEKAGEGTDTVLSYAKAFTLAANVENLTLGTGAVSGTGNAAANHLVGNDVVNILKGEAGNDLLDGGKGGDVMIGGTGSDRYVVDTVADKVVERSGEGVDTVVSSVSYKLVSPVENLVLTGTGNLSGTGSGWHNVITGNDGANVITGMGGADVLTGGKGADTFRYLSAADAGDTIKDFHVGQDKLDLGGVMTSIGAQTTNPVKDGLVELVQQGAHTAVVLHAPDAQPVKLVTLENVDAHALAATADHWV
ncbi:MAG: calcium-binding protein [Magnetospirillum sp.]|nr:calcium-binding protein [Magnetospirillum sp.]